MILKNAFLGLFFGVTCLTCGVIQANQNYFHLDRSELKFIYSLDQIHISQPQELDYLFLSGFGIKYLEWKRLFLDEIEADHYEAPEIDEIEDYDQEVKLQTIGRFILFGRCRGELAKQVPVDGHR